MVKNLKKKRPEEIEREKRERGFALYVTNSPSGSKERRSRTPSSSARQRSSNDRKKKGLGPPTFDEELKVSPPRGKWSQKITPLRIKTESGEGVELAAPSSLTGDYEDDFESCSSDSQDEGDASDPLSLSIELGKDEVSFLRESLEKCSSGDTASGLFAAALASVNRGIEDVDDIDDTEIDEDRNAAAKKDAEVHEKDSDVDVNYMSSKDPTRQTSNDSIPECLVLEFPPSLTSTKSARSNPEFGIGHSGARANRQRPSSGPTSTRRPHARIVRPSSGPITGRKLYNTNYDMPGARLQQLPRDNASWIPTTPVRVQQQVRTRKLRKESRSANPKDTEDARLSTILHRALQLGPSDREKLKSALAVLDGS